MWVSPFPASMQDLPHQKEWEQNTDERLRLQELIDGLSVPARIHRDRYSCDGIRGAERQVTRENHVPST
jgi:hypothetical protein